MICHSKYVSYNEKKGRSFNYLYYGSITGFYVKGWGERVVALSRAYVCIIV